MGRWVEEVACSPAPGHPPGLHHPPLLSYTGSASGNTPLLQLPHYKCILTTEDISTNKERYICFTPKHLADLDLKYCGFCCMLNHLEAQTFTWKVYIK